MIAELGALKAWYSTLSTLTEGQRQHLLAWTTSMRKVGKGTGKTPLFICGMPNIICRIVVMPFQLGLCHCIVSLRHLKSNPTFLM